MITTAKIIQCACRAGLVLTGKNEDGELQWIGNDGQWALYKHLTDFVERFGYYSWNLQI